ncbi:O-methyltransferase [Gracilimonas sp. Q87]|uniref:O-methyltransferase n=1 Tax=Gracilimonas sp. Q87 TaxID=3384766 RepID=UPI003983E837
MGTFTGYSALMMAEALPDSGEIVTMEMNVRNQELAERHFRQYDKKGAIKLIKGNAQDELLELNGEFDMVYIDADKLSYEYYYNQVMDKLKSGGLIVMDNVLWNGAVLDLQDSKAVSLHEFNLKVSQNDRVEQILLPIRDGLLIVKKI